MRWISDIVCIPEVVIWVVGYPSIICIVKIIMTQSHFLVQRRNSGHVFSFSMIACLMLFMFSFRLLVAMFLWETVVMRYVVAMRGIALWALWEVCYCYEMWELCCCFERYCSVKGILLQWALWKVWALWEVCCCYYGLCERYVVAVSSVKGMLLLWDVLLSGLCVFPILFLFYFFPSESGSLLFLLIPILILGGGNATGRPIVAYSWLLLVVLYCFYSYY